ncbi:hypothetical protein AB4Z46_06125 [Variovorax sp. M-6]|uniref:hypothetical protein n=1 Tax=Variovorax sp. M-6 TaxID=3233041 RepID=UPI003F99E034
MKSNLLMLSLLLASWGLPTWAGPAGMLGAGNAPRMEARDGGAGRRLSPAELAQLRQQVRQQWAPAPEGVRSAESQPAERMMPDAPSKGASTTPRSQRP